MLDKLFNFFGMGEAKSNELPLAPVPKSPNKPTAYPGHVKNVKTSETKLQRTDRRLATGNVLDFRSRQTTFDVLRELSAASPDLSASVDAYIRTAITDEFTLVARNPDGTANPEATSLAHQIIARLDYLRDYSEGFSTVNSLRSCSEQLARELRLYGSCALELVLDKQRLPQRLQPVHTPSITFVSEDRYVYPVQKVGGDEINLDVPTFFYVSVDQDLKTPYSDSPMEAAIQAVLFDSEFMNDIRRVVKSAIHPRPDVSISTEMLLKSIPMELQTDDKAKDEYIKAFISAIATDLANLAPEDALVHLDNISIAYLSRGNTSLDAEYRELRSLTEAKIATGSKTMPSILGHGSGSSNIASSEALLFMRSASGSVQKKLNEIYSQALTLAVRLMGQDCYVEFKYAEIDLRPAHELEAFKAMKQSRILEQLSLGMISDEEACIMLTGRLPVSGAPKLSGTFFHNSKAPNSNAYSNTAQGQGSTTNQTLKPDTPTGEKSKKKDAK